VKPGGGSECVADDLGAAREHGLAPVGFGGRAPARGKELDDAIPGWSIELERSADCFRHAVARNVVVGGAETAGHNQQSCRCHAFAQECRDRLHVIAHRVCARHTHAGRPERSG
jgi:hypothetical protein